MTLRIPLVLGANGLPQQLQSGDTLNAPTNIPSIISLINGESSVGLVIGMPVYVSAAGTVKRAEANAASTANVLGLCYDVSIAASASGNICEDGLLTATTTQWDAVVTSETGGLTFGTLYFLDPANIGKLTSTVPTTVGQLVVLVGIGVSSTIMNVNVRPPILL
jgi:hypothetical protein